MRPKPSRIRVDGSGMGVTKLRLIAWEGVGPVRTTTRAKTADMQNMTAIFARPWNVSSVCDVLRRVRVSTV